MKFWIYCVLREAYCQEAAFCFPVWGVLRTENPLVIPVTDGTAPGGSWSWYSLWRNDPGLSVKPLCWNQGCFDTHLLHQHRTVKGSLWDDAALWGHCCSPVTPCPQHCDPCRGIALKSIYRQHLMMLSALFCSSYRSRVSVSAPGQASPKETRGFEDG